MIYRYLSILEISGKQAYIFSSNKLRDNVTRSEEIAYITSAGGIAELTKGTGTFHKDENYVYAGGGHTILEFTDEDQSKALTKARAFGEAYSTRVHEVFPEADLFIRTISYNESKTPGENLEDLTRALEEKKSVRAASFHQGSFGIEKVDSTTLDPKRIPTADQKGFHDMLGQTERMETRRLMPEGYRPSYKFEDLGGAKGDSNFIAVVHVDGNGMGKRVNDFYQSQQNVGWDEFKAKVRDFSDAIDEDFKAAFRQMTEKVDRAIREGRLTDLDLTYKNPISAKKSSGDNLSEADIEMEDKEDEGRTNFPVRRIITSGDDICFVSEGRIGIECARAFVDALGSRQNRADGKGYNACAGVAIVHVKYPFFRAYQLAEELCSNAKKYGASISPEDNGQGVSSIDWHIEQGEIGDSLAQIRGQYEAADHTRLELRPYILRTSTDVLSRDPNRAFDKFETVLTRILGTAQDNARSSLKTLRTNLLEGKTSTDYFLNFYKLRDIVRKCYIGNYVPREEIHVAKGQQQDAEAYVRTYEKGQDHPETRSILYDAIEIMDTYLPLERRQADAD